MKKLLSLLIAAMLVLSLSICAFAHVYVYEDDDAYDDSEEFSIVWFIGPIAGFIAVAGVWFSYKSGVHGEKYPLSQYSKLHLTASSDNFTHRTVVITRIPDPPSNKK